MKRIGHLMQRIAEPENLRVAFGMDFLGYRIFPRRVGLARRSRRRFCLKFRRYESAFRCGVWGELKLQQRVQALVSFVLPADSWRFRSQVLQRFGVVANGLEPRAPRGQLEQQRQIPPRPPCVGSGRRTPANAQGGPISLNL